MRMLHAMAKGAAFAPDYIVDKSATADGIKLFNTAQEAVNRALADSKDHPARRLYMLLKPGTYQELVYIPASAPPIMSTLARPGTVVRSGMIWNLTRSRSSGIETLSEVSA